MRKRVAELVGCVLQHEQMEEELSEAKERYRGIVEDLPDLICRYKADMTITFVNDAFSKYFGNPVHELIGRNFLEFVPHEFHDYIRARISTLSSEAPFICLEHEVVTPEGLVRWQRWHDRAIFNGSGAVFEVQSIGQDITERKHMEERLRELSVTDELTGLYNRRGFFTLGEKQLKIAGRMKNKMLLFSADLDGLKKINDTYGHHEGDRALIDAAGIVRECFRGSDIIARIGGDEFVVLLTEKANVDPAMLAKRIREQTERRNSECRRSYPLSFSIGMASYDPGRSSTLGDLLVAADRSMYDDKKKKVHARVAG